MGRSLSLRLIHNQRVKTVTLPGCHLYPEAWSRERQEVVYPENNPRRTAHLQQLESCINNKVDLLNRHLGTLQKQGRYDIEDLVKLYRLRKDGDKLLGYTKTLTMELERRGRNVLPVPIVPLSAVSSGSTRTRTYRCGRSTTP